MPSSRNAPKLWPALPRYARDSPGARAAPTVRCALSMVPLGGVAAERDQTAGTEAELLCAEHGGDDDVAAALQATIRAQAHAFAKSVRHQHLLCLSESQLPRHARVLDR